MDMTSPDDQGPENRRRVQGRGGSLLLVLASLSLGGFAQVLGVVTGSSPRLAGAAIGAAALVLLFRLGWRVCGVGVTVRATPWHTRGRTIPWHEIGAISIASLRWGYWLRVRTFDGARSAAILGTAGYGMRRPLEVLVAAAEGGLIPSHVQLQVPDPYFARIGPVVGELRHRLARAHPGFDGELGPDEWDPEFDDSDGDTYS